jgi:O-antigen/teichoic acid export membrane protein
MTIRSSLYSVLPDFALGYAERIEASPIRYRLARGAFWSLAGSGASKGLALLAAIAVARLLGTKGFGAFGILQSTVGMFAVLGGFGLGLTATKHVADYRSTDPVKAGRLLSLSLNVAVGSGALAAILLLALADPLARGPLAAPQLAGVLRIGAPLLLLGAISGVQNGALAGFEAFRRIASVNLIAGAASFPILLVSTWMAGLRGAAWGLVVAALLTCAAGHFALRGETSRYGVPLWLTGWRREDASVLWDFSFPSLIAGSLLMPVNWLCAMILVSQPDGYASMGLFNAANQWRTLMLFVPNAIVGSVLPVLANSLSAGDTSTFRKAFRGALTVNVGIAACGAAIIALAAPLILVVYGRSFGPGATILRILCLVVVLDSFTNVTSYVLIASGRLWRHTLFYSTWAVSLVVAATVLVPRSSAIGLACAYLVAQAIYAAVLGLSLSALLVSGTGSGGLAEGHHVPEASGRGSSR